MTNSAPAAAPPTEPAPPITTITRKSIDSSSPNDSGTIRPNASAISTPPRPAYIDDTQNAAAL